MVAIAFCARLLCLSVCFVTALTDTVKGYVVYRAIDAPIRLTVMSPCPPIVSRDAWKARAAKPGVIPIQGVPDYVIIHHSDSAACKMQSACMAEVRSFQNYHMDTKGWDDIGYNFLVGEDGYIYEGRGWGKVGAHTRHHNANSIGICFIGTFATVAPSAGALDLAQRLIACGVQSGDIQPSYTLRGHRDLGSTTCPGQTLYDIIKKWPHY